MDVLSAAVGDPTDGSTKDFIIGILVGLIVALIWFVTLFRLYKTRMKGWLCVLTATAVTIAVIVVFFGISTLVEWLILP